MARTPRYRIVQGLRMPLGFPLEGLESGLRYEAAASDVFVASYPKSGTTWLQYIVYLLIRGRRLGSRETLTAAFPHLEEVGAGAVGALPEPRLIKTHLAFALAPYHPDARYLVIERNPFDCAVSFYHHTRGFPRHYDFAAGSFAEFFACFIRGEVDFGDYFDHLTSWRLAAGRENVRLLAYERLKAEPATTIRDLAAFLGPVALASVARDADLEAVIEETSIASMQRDQQRWSSQRPDWAPAFVRKGVVGDWRSLFTPAMARELLAKCDERLGRAGLEDSWPEIAAAARALARA